ncbi:MAG: cytochrome P450 [Rhodospirillaceae bacterium]|nr:cytochrome P450 [Rhodospirillaceae bacterium]
MNDQLDDVETARSFDLNKIGQDFINDPFPTLKLLRENDPVHRNPDGTFFLTRYEDVLACFRHPAMSSDKKVAFKGKFGDGPLYTHHTTSLVFNDPPYHTTVRKLLSVAFTPRKLAEMEPLIVSVVDDLLDRMEDEKEFDIISAFAMALPTEIISFMLGIPEDHRHLLRPYSLKILGALDPAISDDRLQDGNAAVAEFATLLEQLIADRRKKGDQVGSQGEVLAALIFGEVDGRKLSEKELVQNCIFLLNAGHETTTSMVGNAIGTLLGNPDQLKRLQDDPALIDTTVEEALRFQSPLQIGNRMATEDATFGGKEISAGTFIHLSVAGANRDPEIFDNPEQFDVGREPNRHLAFGSGHHICLGATLARMESKIAIGRLIERFPNIRQNGPAEHIGLARFRGYNLLNHHQ